VHLQVVEHLGKLPDEEEKEDFVVLVSWVQLDELVSAAMSCTPGCFSRMNSLSLLITVFKKGQWVIKKFGNWLVTYMMSVAT
jgi:hypothetical protein